MIKKILPVPIRQKLDKFALNKAQLNYFSLKQLRWYDAPNYALNHIIAAQTARRQTFDYGDASRQKLDFYTPLQPRPDGALIIFIHGGSWLHGSKDDYVFLGQYFATAGFHVAILNYRLAPQYDYYDFVADVIQAVNWLHHSEQSARLGYQPQHSFMLGHSAGAFNMMAAIYHAAENFSQSINRLDYIKGLIGIAGPYSFEHRGDPLAQYALPQQVPPAAIMPNYFVFSNSIAHLLLVAERDDMVGIKNAERLRDALQQVGNRVSLRQIKRTNHISIIATLSRGLARLFATETIVNDFIEQALNGSEYIEK